MQIDPQENFEPEFVDLAWSQMKNLLDEAMPVEEKKRRFLWIWFVGLGLLLLISCSIYWYAQRAIFIRQQTQQQPPIAQLPVECDTIYELISTQKIPERQAITFVLNDKTNNPQLNDNVPIVNATDKLVENTSTNLAVDHRITPVTWNAPAIEIPKESVSFLVDTTQEQNSSYVVHQDSIINTMNNSPILTFFAPAVSFPLVTTPNKSLQRWNIGVEVGGVYQPATNVGGYVGTYLGYQLQPKWDIELGINYVGLESKIPPLEVGLQGSQERMAVNSMDFSSITKVDSLIGKTVTTAHLQIPLRVNYRIKNHWKVSTGATYWIDVRSKEHKTLEKLLSQDSEFFVTNKLPEKTDLEITSFQFSIQGGLSYQFTPHWSITATYQRMITKEKTSLIGLGTRYEW